MSDTHLRCPRCDRRVRITARELERRRGFCAHCDARFGLDAPVVHGDGPERALVHVQAVPLPPRAKPRRIRIVSTQPLEVRLRPRRVRVDNLAAGVATAALGAFQLVADAGALIVLVPALAGYAVAQGVVRRSQHVRIAPGWLTLLDARGTPAVPLDEAVELVPSPRGTLAVTARGQTVILGAGLGLSMADVLWLRDAIADACRATPI